MHTFTPSLPVAREAARLAHAAYTDHVVTGVCCMRGRLCRVGELLLAAADDAGKAWELAEARVTPSPVPARNRGA